MLSLTILRNSKNHNLNKHITKEDITVSIIGELPYI